MKKRLKEMDNRDNDPLNTFISMVSEDAISDDDLNGFIRNFSEMTELNLFDSGSNCCPRYTGELTSHFCWAWLAGCWEHVQGLLQ